MPRRVAARRRLRSAVVESCRRLLGAERLQDAQAVATAAVVVAGRRRPYDHQALGALVETGGPVVRAGPFEGLRYGPIARRFGERIAAKLLGSYECELHDAIGSVITDGCPLVVDVGAADGYYAVGMARAAAAPVIAYEAEPLARRLCRETARVNGMDGLVEVRGACTVTDLAGLTLPDGSLLILDCEGCEDELVDSVRVPALANLRLVVELHPFLRPGVAERVVGRLSATHRVELVASRARYPLDWPELVELPGLSELQRELALNELRPTAMRWVICVPTWS